MAAFTIELLDDAEGGGPRVVVDDAGTVETTTNLSAAGLAMLRGALVQLLGHFALTEAPPAEEPEQ